MRRRISDAEMAALLLAVRDAMRFDYDAKMSRGAEAALYDEAARSKRDHGNAILRARGFDITITGK